MDSRKEEKEEGDRSYKWFFEKAFLEFLAKNSQE